MANVYALILLHDKIVCVFAEVPFPYSELLGVSKFRFVQRTFASNLREKAKSREGGVPKGINSGGDRLQDRRGDRTGAGRKTRVRNRTL